ncbi:MAG: hypothetical protein HYU66_23795, partial [Armatimonadetes bacterium]|nr:hypothetical protein [Armatimonadota bacterium]
ADTTRRAAEQIDGGVYLGGLACLLQSKTGNQVDYEPIAVLANQLRRRPSSVVGAVFSLHDFTPAALTLARFTAPQTVLLWQGAEFALALRNSVCVAGLVWKYRQAIELGIPDASLSDFDDITDLRRLNPVGGL